MRQRATVARIEATARELIARDVPTLGAAISWSRAYSAWYRASQTEARTGEMSAVARHKHATKFADATATQ